ncbi:hypothetical protein HK414_02960 [Ramlibacter terrae]|uniref:Uncharacterized protein n=1 Tax=Ramlibacter terrae TaxID=2732511 RepID=A0ABX6P0C2_9BURK|nr:hypothetical protein HK414_02960 [Ramlibacter terrae]
MVTVPWAPLVTEEMTRPAPSKLSLASTSVTTAVSSVVLAVSVAMSVTGVTLRLIVRVAVLPLLSVTATVKLSAPW